jgi:threonine synthase
MGLALQLEVAERLGHRLDAPLAIASCGNAALAAAVVAPAANRPHRVFVPTSADENVVTRLRALGAEVTRCVRGEGVAGDPSYLAFRAAVAAGAVPFTCQGGDNGLTLDGGRTLGYELAVQLRQPLDRLYVQVGGGALASATFSALGEAVRLGWMKALPTLHPVQTRGGFPLYRAWERLVAWSSSHGAPVGDAIAYAAGHRSEFMWPWEEEPKSIAHGILDDETYDWLAIVRALAESGGAPVLVDEAQLEEANLLGRGWGIDVDPTGSSGLAGYLANGQPPGRAGVIFSGARR